MPSIAKFSAILVPGIFKGGPLMAPEIPAPLPGPAVPQEPAAGNTGGSRRAPAPARPAWPASAGLAAGRGRRTGRPGRRRGDGELRRAVPAGGRGPAPGPGGRAGGGDPGRGCAGVRLPGRRPGAAWPPGDPGAAAERRVGGRVGVHERDRGRAGLAEPRGVGDASGRLRAGERHADRGCPHQHRRPPPGRREGRAGAAEVSLLAALGGLALWLLRLSLAPRSTTARVPRVGDRGVPGRPRPPRRPPRPGAAPAMLQPRPALLPSGAARPAGPGRPGDDLPDDRTTAGDSSRERHTARTAAGGPPRHRRSVPLARPGGASPGAARRRPPGSWRSSPRSTGRWPASPRHRWRGSAPCPPPWPA